MGSLDIEFQSFLLRLLLETLRSVKEKILSGENFPAESQRYDAFAFMIALWRYFLVCLGLVNSIRGHMKPVLVTLPTVIC